VQVPDTSSSNEGRVSQARGVLAPCEQTRTEQTQARPRVLGRGLFFASGARAGVVGIKSAGDPMPGGRNGGRGPVAGGRLAPALVCAARGVRETRSVSTFPRLRHPGRHANRRSRGGQGASRPVILRAFGPNITGLKGKRHGKRRRRARVSVPCAIPSPSGKDLRPRQGCCNGFGGVQKSRALRLGGGPETEPQRLVVSIRTVGSAVDPRHRVSSKAGLSASNGPN